MPQMSLASYAKIKGWARQTLYNKIKRGTITEAALLRDPDGRVCSIDTDRANADLKVNGNPAKAVERRAAGLKTGYVENSGEIGDSDDDWLEAEISGHKPADRSAPIMSNARKETREIDGKPIDVKVIPPAQDDYSRLRDAKTSKEELNARKLQIEIDEIEGRLLDAEGVRKLVVKRVAETKDFLTNLPGKLAPLLVGITDVVEMETTLMKEVNHALEALFKLGDEKFDAKDD